MKHFNLIVFIIFCLATHTTAQIVEKGLPFIKNYTASEYNAHPETWAVTQDTRGLMYFGNQEGVLEFDGVSWRLIKIPNKSIVKSLDCAKNGRVFLGAQGEIGYLIPNSQGKTMYVSLLDKIPEQYRNFRDVWQTFATPNGAVWFRSPELIFLYKNDKIKVFLPSSNQSFHKAFFVDNNFYVREIGKGLLKYQNNKLILVPEGAKFAQDKIYLMLDYGKDKLLLGSREQGLMFYDGQTFKTWKVAVNETIKKIQIYGGITLYNKQYFAITGLQGGLLIINRKGQVIQHINQEKGLLNDIITNLIADNNGNLWFSSLSGISYVEINSDFGLLSEELGIKGTVYSAMLYQDKLFLGTTSGLYAKEWKKYSNPLNDEENRFQKIPQTDGQALDLDTLKGKLLIGHYQGLLSWNGKNIQTIAGDIYVWKILKLRGKTESFIVSTRQGLYSVAYKNGQWQLKSKIKGYTEDSPYIAEAQNGDIWTSTPNGEVFRMKVNQTLDKVESLKKYTSKEGLPSDFDNYVFAQNQGIILATEQGVFEYNAQKDKFEANQVLNKMLGSQKQIKKIAQDKQGNIWYQKIETNTQTQKINYSTGVFYKTKNKQYKLLKNTYRLNERALENIILVDTNSLVFGTAIGGIYHTLDKKRWVANQNKVFIRSVRANFGKKDTVFFQGNFRNAENLVQLNQHPDSLLKVPFIFNDLTFNFTTTSYIGNKKNEYQFYLKGYDKDWSEWTKETQKNYTNLPEGTYTFYVKARDIYEQESNITSYQFVILPPWYRTMVAYIVYILLFILFIWFLIRRVEKRRILLEKKVEEATLEARKERDKVLEQKRNLEDANDSIQIQHRKIESQKKRIEKALAQQKEQNELLKSQEEMLLYNMQQLEKTQRELNGQLEAINKSAIIKTEYSATGEILNINGAFTKVTGYKPEELIGKQHKSFISKGISEEEYQVFWEELRIGNSNTGEYKRYDKNGKAFWINSTYFPVRDEDGNITKIISLAFDITESKSLLEEIQQQTVTLQAQEEEMKQNMEVLLETQEMMLQTQVELDGQLNAINSSTIIKAEFDLKGYVVDANKEFQTFFGYEEDSFSKLHHKMMVSPEYAYSFEYEYFWTSLKEGAKQPGEYLRINKNNEEVWLNATYTPVKNKDGEVYKIIKLAFDITESKKLFNEIQKQNNELQEQEKIILENIEELKSTQKQLEEQNQKVEKKNHLITSSINYAKNIQTAILPTKNQLLQFFSECFILYLPKDIVSGDFYWYTQVEKEHFLAVFDCTGHGVPGAFMSMIGNALLSDIVNNQRITNPAEILEKLNKGVISRLKQEETGNYDGMELSLCKFEKKNKSITKVIFAGAKLPLYYVKNNELKKVKGTRKAIGGWQSEVTKEFENNVLFLEKGTQLYFFSDGFADTANAQRKKIGSQGFQRILSRIYQKPDEIQKDFLKEALAIHQEGGEQRDDITVLGVRI